MIILPPNAYHFYFTTASSKLSSITKAYRLLFDKKSGTEWCRFIIALYFYCQSTTFTQLIRICCSSGFPLTDWDAATMGIHFCTYCLAVSLFLQKELR